MLLSNSTRPALYPERRSFTNMAQEMPSRRGRHAYYDDDTPRANATWAALGCRGDIRGAKGYLVLHEDGCERLAEALDHRVPGTAAG